ncbi:tetratricopeptide repeat protein [Thermodesulfobacteriota bacterium]
MGLLKALFRPNPERHEQSGDTRVRASDWGMAKLAYEAALDALEKTAPGDAESKARILEKLQGSMEALAHEHMRTAEDLIESGHDEDARELLELALELCQDPAFREDIDNLLQGMGGVIPEINPGQAALPVLSVHDGDRENHEVGEQETFLALIGPLPDEVRRAYTSYGSSFRAGYLALNQGAFAFAADALSRAMEENPSPNSFIPIELATALLNLQRPDEAREWLETFIEHHPDALPGYQVLCEVFWEMEAFDRAEALLETCPEELKNSLAYVLLRGESLSQAGRHSEAAAFYESFMNEYGRHDAVLKVLAGSYEGLENLKEARELYIEIMNQCRSCHTRVDPLVQRKFADISFDLNERSTAVLESYLSLAQEDPSNRPFYFQRISEIYAAMGNQEEARRFHGFARQVAGGRE